MNPLPVLLNFGGMFWALVTSTKRWRTLGWMVGSWLITMATLYIASIILSRSAPPNSDVGGALAAAFTIPSFLVPAVVGVIHARRNKRRINIQEPPSPSLPPVGRKILF